MAGNLGLDHKEHNKREMRRKRLDAVVALNKAFVLLDTYGTQQLLPVQFRAMMAKLRPDLAGSKTDDSSDEEEMLAKSGWFQSEVSDVLHSAHYQEVKEQAVDDYGVLFGLLDENKKGYLLLEVASSDLRISLSCPRFSG